MDTGLAHHQRPCAQRHHLVGRQAPDATLDDIEHGPLAAAARHHDISGLIGRADQGKRHGQLDQPPEAVVAGQIDGIGFQSQPLAGRQEGGLVEA